MRVETIHGRHLLCGHILQSAQIKPDQIWAAADGADRQVRILSNDRGYIIYLDGSLDFARSAFDFQTRYCLVLAPPDELKGYL